LADKDLKGKLFRSVSFTTRPKRSGEISGRDYFFVSENDFRKRLKEKKILEWTKYLGYYYGTPKDFVDRLISKPSGLIFCLDFKGALRIKRLYPENSVTVFVMPSSIKELNRRISGRCSETKKEEIAKRVELAREEVLQSKAYDYRLVNKDLNKAISGLKTIFLTEFRARLK
jgi:guanylate kinase